MYVCRIGRGEDCRVSYLLLLSAFYAFLDFYNRCVFIWEV